LTKSKIQLTMLKHLLFSVLFLGILVPSTQAQTTLFSEDFEGGTNQFTLNTTDMSSTASGFNSWIVNNSYTGGSISVCGLPGTPIPATPTQPGGVTGGPSSNYMHIVTAAGISAGVTNCHFVASDGGLFCVNDENYFASMSSDINVTGLDTVNISFYYLCGGSAANYGEVYYSTNGGASWTVVTGLTNLFNTPSWAQISASVPLSSASTFRIGFRFVNNFTLSTSDPAFGVDQISITAPNSTSIAAPTFTGTTFCSGDQLTINYNLTGTFSSGNQFTAELSDASGSFASPTTIGSVTATTATPITATIPAVAAGGQYRIRVVASNPGTTGADNGANITIGQAPVGGTAALSQDTVCAGAGTNVSLTGEIGTISWQESSDGITYVASSNTGNSFAVNPNADLYLRAIVSNSCGADTSNVIQVVVRPTPIASFNYSQNLSALDINFVNNTNGTYSSVLWAFGDGNQTTNDDPTYTYSTAGSYVVTLTVTNDEGCSTSFTDTINVVAVGVEEVEAIGLANMNLYPNPASSQATLELELTDLSDLQVNLLDVYGRQLRTISNARLDAGTHQIQLNQLNELPAGMYLIDVQTNKGRKTLKLRLQ
jgi:PKD repeat protein